MTAETDATLRILIADDQALVRAGFRIAARLPLKGASS